MGLRLVNLSQGNRSYKYPGFNGSTGPPARLTGKFERLRSDSVEGREISNSDARSAVHRIASHNRFVPMRGGKGWKRKLTTNVHEIHVQESNKIKKGAYKP